MKIAIVMDPKYNALRGTLKNSCLALIQETIEKINSMWGSHLCAPASHVDVYTDIQSARGKGHSVCLLYAEKAQDLWYKDESSDMYIIECPAPSVVVLSSALFPKFYYATLKALYFDYFFRLAKLAENTEQYKVIRDIEQVDFKTLFKSKKLACDIETRGFSWTRDPMLVHGFHDGDCGYIILQSAVEKHNQKFKEFIEDKEFEFAWQNGKFDTRFYRHAGWNGRVDNDTLLASYALDERGGEVHRLEELAVRWLNAPRYKHQVVFETVDPNDPDLHAYLAKDILYTRLIMDHFEKVFEIEAFMHSGKMYRDILLKANYALRQLEENGIYVDQEYTTQLEKDFSAQLEVDRQALQNVVTEIGFDPHTYIQYVIEEERKVSSKMYNVDLPAPRRKAPEAFNPGSPKQLQYVLFELLKFPVKGKRSTEKKVLYNLLFFYLGFPDTDEDTFFFTEKAIVDDWLAKDPELFYQKKFLWSLISFRKFNKMHSTYIVNALKYSQADGRIHSTFKIFGTVTGRLSSGDPMNLQNIPRRKDIKNVFCAPPGKVLLECDLSQAELRVLAHLSKDPVMVDAYNTGQDLHDIVATKIYGPDFTKEQRVGAKTINFGLAYGRGASSVAAQIRKTVPEAQKMIDEWAAGMPVAWDKIQEIRQIPFTGNRCINLLGRERRFWLLNHKNRNKVENESINFPIQSVASDITLMALYDVIKEIESDPIKWEGVMPVNIIHDAILLEVPLDKLQMAKTMVVNYMEDTAFKLIPDFAVPIVADAEYSTTGWGNKKKLV